MALQSTIQVKVLAATKTLYDGPAYAVSSVNELGKFDVLEDHIAFVTLVKEKVIVHTTSHDKQEFQINRGVLTVKNGVVKVYVGL